MPAIQVSGLTFAYEGSYTNIFDNTSFMIDTDWRLGLIGRNGRGKTTFLSLLMGKYRYQGSIAAPCGFSYFPFETQDTERPAMQCLREVIAPYQAMEAQMDAAVREGDMAAYSEAFQRYTAADGYEIEALLERETGRLGLRAEALTRPFFSLSNGERTKAQLAALFLRKNNFLLIDEPTDHLDAEGREAVKAYLATKKGFIVVSHDRAFLDAVCDHILSINRATIDVQQGNYSTWEQNKRRQDDFEMERNAALKRDIKRLRAAAEQKAGWSDKVEATKIGGHSSDRGAIGHKAAKMMSLAKNIERRQQNAIAEKEGLMHDLELVGELKMFPLAHPKERLLDAVELSVDYGAGPLFGPKTFSVAQGERLCLAGGNGCGKSSVLRRIVGQDVPGGGLLRLASGMAVSYLPQDAAELRGPLRAYAAANSVDETLFLTVLRKLDFPRVNFERDLAELSMGQRKKVLLARSLCQRAHLFIWDEPLNYIDVISRGQIERAILQCAPTMIFVEHDEFFRRRIATKILEL